MVSVVRFFLVIVSLLTLGCGDDPEAPGAKTENSVIEAMGARYEHVPIEQLTLKTEMEHHFALVPWRGHHVCIMLDPTHAPYYKQVPWSENFCLSQRDFDAIEHSGSATRTVIAALASHVCDSAGLQ